VFALIGLVVKDPETAALAGFLPIMPFIFASTVFVRAENMPGWLQVFSRNQPVSQAVDSVRALSEGGPVAGSALHAAAWIVALVAVCGSLSVVLYKRG
jgi:ABC-type multidrug transport system permease subunit